MGFCDGSVADWRSIHALIEITSPEGRSGEVISIKACMRSEEHTSELQSQSNLVCRLLLEKKKKIEEDVHKIEQQAKYLEEQYIKEYVKIPKFLMYDIMISQDKKEHVFTK